MIITVVLFLVVAFLLFFLGKKWFGASTGRLFVIGWIMKCLAGVGFIYVYTYYYGNGKLTEDSGAFFREAKILANIKGHNSSEYYSILFEKHDSEKLIATYFEKNANSRFSRQETGINDTRNQIKLISILLFLFQGNTNLIFLFFFLLSYLGILLLWKALKENSNLNGNVTFALLILPPSLLFWTSNNLKEPLYILGLCLIFSVWVAKQKSNLNYFYLLLGIIFLLFFKPLLLVILLISRLIYLILEKTIREKRKEFLLLAVFAIFGLFYFSIPSKGLKIISDKQFDFINVGRGGYQVAGDTCFYYIEKEFAQHIIIKDSVVTLQKAIPAMANLFQKIRNEKKILLLPNQEKLKLNYYQKGGGSTFDLTPINNKWTNLMKAIPEGIVNTFLRPFPWQNDSSKINWLFFLENVFFIGLIFWISLKNKFISSVYRKLKWTSFLTIFILSVIIGVTTPVSGAILRYHIPIQLLIIIVFVLTWKKNEQLD